MFRLTLNARIRVVNVLIFDCSDSFNTLQCCLVRSQRPEALPETKQSFQRCMITFDPIISPLFIGVFHAIQNEGRSFGVAPLKQ